MKGFIKIIHLALLLILCGRSQAQTSIGETGMFVKSSTVFAVNGLSLIPSEDWTLTTNKLNVEQTPIPGNPNPSISRVYRFSYPLTFSGNVAIRYLSQELNGNDASSLQIAHSADNNTFTQHPESTVNAGNYLVSAMLNNVNFMVLTAGGSKGALPVTLTNFSVATGERSALLQWTTSQEINADFFEIEHSRDALNWNVVGKVKARGEETRSSSYEFVHHDLFAGQHYYRLKMVDTDGSFARSLVRTIHIQDTEFAYVFPNPASERLFLNKPALALGQVLIFDPRGSEYLRLAHFPADGIDIKKFTAGKYTVRLTNPDGTETVHTFVKH
jgi:hypothetical protein